MFGISSRREWEATFRVNVINQSAYNSVVKEIEKFGDLLQRENLYPIVPIEKMTVFAWTRWMAQTKALYYARWKEQLFKKTVEYELVSIDQTPLLIDLAIESRGVGVSQLPS